MPFGLGRPVRSTLTLLILVPRTPLPLEPAPHAYTSPLHVLARPPPFPPRPPLKGRGHAEGGRIRCGYDPLRGGFSLGARVLAGDYGKHCPEGMLGVASALPGTRTFTA